MPLRFPDMTNVPEQVMNPTPQLQEMLDGRTYIFVQNCRIRDNFGFGIAFEITPSLSQLSLSFLASLLDVSITVRDTHFDENTFGNMGKIPSNWLRPNVHKIHLYFRMRFMNADLFTPPPPAIFQQLRSRLKHESSMPSQRQQQQQRRWSNDYVNQQHDYIQNQSMNRMGIEINLNDEADQTAFCAAMMEEILKKEKLEKFFIEEIGIQLDEHELQHQGSQDQVLTEELLKEMSTHQPPVPTDPNGQISNYDRMLNNIKERLALCSISNNNLNDDNHNRNDNSGTITTANNNNSNNNNNNNNNNSSSNNNINNNNTLNNNNDDNDVDKKEIAFGQKHIASQRQAFGRTYRREHQHSYGQQ
ncbi:RmlC-like cupin family protein [Reticulomyxa filosa]|uniref:RmlC-like cupin family protein n=1 Tax=Reticulomyxa filosa TaxID=46433 RepID=X6MS41_RETFI|nr:RmlC-like cupin family protein [Reticulomyxa filosa]|eukprot:ETO16664.1 RmlC-like cupin family protein [Reticulomyxa filosa]